MIRDDPEPKESSTIIWTERARRDLLAIGDFIAADDTAAALSWVKQLVEVVERAAEMPLAGRIVPELNQDDIRERIKGNYRIVYRVVEGEIEVLTVFEGHRKFWWGLSDEDGD